MATGSTARHPFASSLPPAFHCLISAVCRWIQSLERLQTSWTMSTMPAEERRKNGRRTADERHPKPCCQALDGRQALDTSADFRRRRIKQFSPVFFSNDGRVVVVYICHRFVQIGQRSAADKSLRLPPNTAALSSLSPSPLRPAQL